MKELLVDFTLEAGLLCCAVRHEVINDKEGFTVGYCQDKGWAFKRSWQGVASFMYTNEDEFPSNKVEHELAVFTDTFDAVILSLEIARLHESVVKELEAYLPFWPEASASIKRQINQRLKRLSKKLAFDSKGSQDIYNTHRPIALP